MKVYRLATEDVSPPPVVFREVSTCSSHQTFRVVVQYRYIRVVKNVSADEVVELEKPTELQK